jgi:hypothetical protein
MKCLLPMALVVALLPLTFGQAMNLSSTKRDVTEGEVVKENLGRQIDTYLAGLESTGFSGAVMVVRNNKLVLLKG